jgi:hypothetical protein
VGSANRGSTLLLFKEKEVGINEGHIIFICLYLSVSPFTRSNHTWKLKMGQLILVDLFIINLFSNLIFPF